MDSSGQVRGASTPFCFRKPASQSLESNLDDDLLVVTTQVADAEGRFGAKARETLMFDQVVFEQSDKK